MTRIWMMCAATIVFGAPGTADAPQKKMTRAEALAEIDRLKKRVHELHGELGEVRRELVVCRDQRARLGRRNAELAVLNNREVGGGDEAICSRKLLDFLRYLADGFGVLAGDTQSRDDMQAIAWGALEAWTDEDRDRQPFTRDALAWFRERIAELRKERGIEKVQQPGLLKYEAKRLCVDLEGKDRVARARYVGTILGGCIEWMGVVIDTVDAVEALYQVELDCDGVTVFANVADKRQGALRGIRIGMTVYVEGAIADVGDTIGSCASALVKGARVETPERRDVRRFTRKGKKWPKIPCDR